MGYVIMAGDFRVCRNCKAEIPRTILDQNFCICPECGAYLRFHAAKRIKSLADEGSFIKWKNPEQFSNPLKDDKYEETYNSAKSKHNLNDAIVDGEMTIDGIKVAIAVMDTRFMMASMGHIVGERVTTLFERAAKRKLPVILFCCSGGARMQEGIVSLMQMEKTAAAVKKYSEAGGFYISVLTNPTMGGVTASFAVLADVILAEKGAMIGFAGARVIQQNTGETLPEGFQTAEFQKEHGLVDIVVERETLRDTLSKLLRLHQKPSMRFKKFPVDKALYEENAKKTENGMTAWETVRTARAASRPTSEEYIAQLFPDFIELAGDRIECDDHAIIGGIASFNGYPVTVIGHQKGKGSVEAACYRNWGMPSPQGYRKAVRLAKQAEKYGRPVIFFVDTVGAACGKKAEETGQGIAIANILQEMSDLKTPILSIVIGEGGSGGALALGVANEVWMMENAVYSILSPEGYASILWKDNSKAPEAAEQMKLEAKDLLNLSIIDRIIYEDEPVTSENISEICSVISNDIAAFLNKYIKMSPKIVAKKRYQKFRQY
jgi:acetyl-CoA carboxylase carboxyl transferase subunit beta